MSFWAKFFGKKKKKEKSKYLPENEIPNDLLCKKSLIKGGRFCSVKIIMKQHLILMKFWLKIIGI